MVHQAGTVDIAALDRFEAVDPMDPQAGEYRREAIAVTPEGAAPLPAHVSLYNRQPRSDFPAIAHGDFARWLRETGHASFVG